jgi:hypothetical protein
VGPARLLEMRTEGIWHNLWTVLLLPGIPLSLIGVLALPWQGRDRASRPIVVLAVTTFLVTSLIFPVATTWGTFLHAAGPIHVLIVLSAILTLDAGIARLGARLGWTRPVAWLGALLGVFSGLLFSLALLPSFGEGSQGTKTYYEELWTRMGYATSPSNLDADPIISNFPIWVAETGRISTLALPDEPPADVVDLAQTFGATLLVLTAPEGEYWNGGPITGPDAECFRLLELPGYAGEGEDPLADTTVYEIDCP